MKFTEAGAAALVAAVASAAGCAEEPEEGKWQTFPVQKLEASFMSIHRPS